MTVYQMRMGDPREELHIHLMSDGKTSEESDKVSGVLIE